MRIYKPSYSKPMPKGAKIIGRKNGNFAKYQDSRGHTTESQLTKSGDKILLETAHWHVEFEDNQGIRRRLKAYTNERSSERLADKIESLLDCQRSNRQPDDELTKWLERIPAAIRDELIKFSLLDAQRIAAGKTLTELAGEFEKSLQAKERSQQHIGETVRMLKRLFKGCGFRYWSDISATKVENHLKDLRDNGKNLSYRRSNGYLQAIKHFCNWMVETNKAGESPVRHLKPLNVELDRRLERRAATPDELRRLLEKTIDGPVRFRMTGYERYLLYRFASETGLRANEIRCLTIAGFDFENLTVTLKAGYSKHRQKDTQPLRPKLAAELKEFFKGKMPGAKAFGGTYKRLTKKTAPMIKADLEAAEIVYIDDNGKVFDFHSVRHTFITNLRNAPSRVAQSLARHKSSAMTDRYTHIRVHDERAALDDLPDLSLPSKEKQQAVKTGTDDKAVGDINVTDKILLKSCFQGAPMRSNTENSGNKTAIKVQKTPLCVNNRGASRTENPCVGGSNPLLPI